MIGKRHSNAFAERMKRQALASIMLDGAEDEVVTYSSSGGRPWTRETAPAPHTNMPDDPFSLWFAGWNRALLMAFGWQDIWLTAWGL